MYIFVGSKTRDYDNSFNTLDKVKESRRDSREWTIPRLIGHSTHNPNNPVVGLELFELQYTEQKNPTINEHKIRK